MAMADEAVVVPIKPEADGSEISVQSDFRNRRRGLELTVQNNTAAATLTLTDQYFFSGTWQENFHQASILPGSGAKALVSNKAWLPTGVTGGLMFTITIEGKKAVQYFIIGFTNPTLGTCKNYITITDEELGAEYGYEHAENNHHKYVTFDEFIIEATLATPADGGKKHMLFTISDKK